MRPRLIAIFLAIAPIPAFAFPILVATCDGKQVDTDGRGTAYVNGTRTAVRAVGTGFEAKLGEVSYFMAQDPGQPPTVSFTGPGRANGMCQVTNFAPAASARRTASPPRSASPVRTASPPRTDAPSRAGASHSERAGLGRFDARGQIPCATAAGMPMNQCAFNVARDPGGNATVVIDLFDGRKRTIFFENGRAISADLSQADGNMNFRVTKDEDLFVIRAGNERYEIPEAAVFGG